MFKRQKLSAPSKQAQSTAEKSSNNNKNNRNSDVVPKKIENKRRSTLGSRVSVHSLLFPSAYATASKDVRQTMSRSVNDLQHTTTSSDQSGDSSSDRDSIINTPSSKTKLKECPLCFIRQPSQNFPQLTCCSHQSCQTCLIQYLQMEILESRVHVTCPECSEMLHPNDIYRLLCEHQHLLEKYEEFSVRRVLMTDPDTRWCPAPDCSYAVIASGCAACPELKCNRPGCNTLFCYHCKMTWHPNQTCNEARAQRGSFAASPIHIDTTIRPGDIKACPRCQTYIVKMNDGSCNHMICALCGAEFCWLCLKEISDLHYLSPSGCTFWGKKPWSRKKKLLWQLGMLVGAPVGIALVAGLAVPAIMFGVPVWIGRKVHQKLKDSTKAKRRVAVTASVVGSILMGPVLATMAVGVGVPIMLAYVYGVVPLSLCRNGSCGVTASPSGVRLDLDADLLAMSGMTDSAPLHEKTQLLSSVDKIDASTVASVRSGSTATQHKMQVHAEVTYTKRRPSIESGATSLGERINYEDASVKALAGSTYYDDKSVHTMGSLAEGGSYCEDQASTKALAGSVICPPGHGNNAETKSLCGAKSVGDNASVRGLAGSICNGVEPTTTITSSGAERCTKCHKPVHVTLQEDCVVVTSADDWRKMSNDSSRQNALETRITKFADQLSVDSYDIGGASSTLATSALLDDDTSSDSNYLLGVVRNGGGEKTLTVPLKKLDSSSLAPRHLTAINEVRHACLMTSSNVRDDEQDECLCGDDGEVLLLPESYTLLLDDDDENTSTSKICPPTTTTFSSSSTSSSWKFLKKSRSWSAKLDSTRAAAANGGGNNNQNEKSPRLTSVVVEQQPSVHYKKHNNNSNISSSWKFKIPRRSAAPSAIATATSTTTTTTVVSNSNAPCVVLTEPKSTKLSNSYTSLPDINQQNRRFTGDSVKRGDRRTPLATTLTNFFKTN